MLDLIPVAKVQYKDTEVEVEHALDPIHSSKPNCIFAKHILGNWIVFTRTAEIISGELEGVIMNYCEENFPYENTLEHKTKRRFLLQGIEHV